jgi:hypothetical protein
MACMKETARITCVLFDKTAGPLKTSPSPGFEVILPECELKYFFENLIIQFPSTFQRTFVVSTYTDMYRCRCRETVSAVLILYGCAATI